MERRLIEILKIAERFGVTDVHFSYYEKEKNIVIEMRVKGEIKQLKPHPDDIRLFRYLMYRANLDISNAFQPQTGSFEEIVNEYRYALRFSIVSSYHIESGVLRILNNHPTLEIDSLTYDKEHIEWMKNIPNHRNGLYVFSGPTGSGKTTTLYTILNSINQKKIYTLEDPVEVVNEKYVQLQINDAQHMSYAEGIRQLMRHDPDIVMIGEIRDEEAATNAIRCALTGHLVLTSIHSSSCVSAIHRLMDLGVEKFQLQDVLGGIANQRLYETKDGNRICIYEILKEKEVKEYFETGQISSSCFTLKDNITKAIQKGIIDKDVAKADLIN